MARDENVIGLLILQPHIGILQMICVVSAVVVLGSIAHEIGHSQPPSIRGIVEVRRNLIGALDWWWSKVHYFRVPPKFAIPPYQKVNICKLLRSQDDRYIIHSLIFTLTHFRRKIPSRSLLVRTV